MKNFCAQISIFDFPIQRKRRVPRVDHDQDTAFFLQRLYRQIGNFGVDQAAWFTRVMNFDPLNLLNRSSLF